MERFSVLQEVYENFVAANFDFSSLPANNKFRRYAEWKENPDLRELPEGAVPLRGSSVPVGVRAFGLVAADAPQIEVDVSGRSFTAVTNGGQFGNVASLYNVDVDASDISPRTGFRPARVVFAQKLATPVQVTRAQNRITGRAYRRSTGDTYTFPFGRSAAGGMGEIETQDAIIAQVQTTHAVTFKPEHLSRAR